MDSSLKPVCSFERLDPKDVASAIRTVATLASRTIVRVAPLGLGYEPFLRWSVQDIHDAAASKDRDQQMRYSVSALMNARRSLSCLADQYILRDGFAYCRDVPREASDKADLLMRRGIFDGLATAALRGAVERRNLVEHQYEQIPLSAVQETVHLIRSTIENCVAKLDLLARADLWRTTGRARPAGGEVAERSLWVWRRHFRGTTQMFRTALTARASTCQPNASGRHYSPGRCIRAVPCRGETGYSSSRSTAWNTLRDPR